MPITAFDHVNLRTPQLDVMVTWYGTYLGLHPGPRPDFPFPGAWLYLGDQPLIHLVGVDMDLPQNDSLTLEHFALKASGLTAFTEGLEAGGVGYKLAHLPGMPVVQVNVYDPDGNHIHVDFDASEMPA